MNNNNSSDSLKTLWFEFLLNPSILETHLLKENPDPAATDLIIQFLANANAAPPPPLEPPANGGMILTNGAPPEVKSEGVEPEKETKKKQALKLLALKVAAFLKWNLTVFELKLPLPMQQTILQELLKIVPPPEENSSPDTLFAQILYHRWVLRVAPLHSYPVRGPKGISVQLPCQSDPTVVPPEVTEAIKKKVQDQLGPSAQFLEDVMAVEGREVRMPTLACLGTVRESAAPEHDWTQGICLHPNDLKCQVLYDLGAYYFFHQDYPKAYKCLKQVEALSSQTATTWEYCTMDQAKFQGYLQACSLLMGDLPLPSSLSLEEKLQRSAATAAHKETIQILLEDNLKRQIPLYTRRAVELDLLRQGESSRMVEVYHQVAVLNAVRRVVEGMPVIPALFQPGLKQSQVDKLAFLLAEALNAILPGLNPQQKLFVKNYISLACEENDSIRNKLLASGLLESVFTDTERAAMMPTKSSLLPTPVPACFTNEAKVELATLERRLLAATEPTEVRDLVQRLQGRLSQLSSSKWELPQFLTALLRNNLSVEHQEYVHFLLAKALQLSSIKKFAEAQILFQQVLGQVELNTRIGRYLSGKVLEAELQAALQVKSRPPSDTRLRAYLSPSLEREHPILELVCSCLLNHRNWDLLTEADFKNDHYLQLNQVMAGCCRDLYTNSRSPSNFHDLWNFVTPMFYQSSGGGHKRTVSGTPKDNSRALVPRHHFTNLLLKLLDTLALGVVISLLAKICCLIRTDSNKDIHMEHSTVWPMELVNSSMYSWQTVAESLHTVLTYALSVHPTHASWLRTMGDLCFAQGHYSTAMKHYMSAAVVVSDYFSQSLRDESLYRRMSQCCSRLGNHTQAAVLGQCQEEPNYGLVFKSLAERGCSDCCDGYYGCLWDPIVLEFLIHCHARRGEIRRKLTALRLAGALELNSHNNEEIQREAASLRRARFLRALATQYL